MKLETRSTMHNVMEMAITNYKKAVDDLAKIHAEKDITDEAKIRRAYKVAEDLATGLNGLQNMLSVACSNAADTVNAARAENSNRLGDHAYQARLLSEAAFLRNPPDTMMQEDIEKRLSVFFGDEMAKTVLMGALLEASENRKSRGVEGFAVDLLLPDVYGVQLAMLEKIQKAIGDKLQSLASGFHTGSDATSTDKNASALVYAEGVFEGVGLYIDQLPDKVKWASSGSAARQYNIPAFANNSGDLDIVFSMYRG